MPYQNISKTLTPLELTGLLTKVNDMKAVLNFLINLTDEERRTIFKMGADSVSQVQLALSYATNNPQFVPGYANLAEAKNDFQLHNDLQNVWGQVNALAEGIDDTRMAAGSEAMQFCLNFYASVKEASRRNVTGAEAIYNELKVFWDKPEQNPPPPPNP